MEGKELFEDAYSKAQIAREYVRNNPEQWYAFYDKIDHEKQRQDELLEEGFEEALLEGAFEVSAQIQCRYWRNGGQRNTGTLERQGWQHDISGAIYSSF